MMTGEIDRPRILKAIKKCLVNGNEFFQKAMDQLDEIGKSSLGTGMTPLIGGYGMKDQKTHYRQALIEIDSAERALKPLITRFKDGRVDGSHFKSDRALVLLRDLVGMDYNILIRKLTEQSGRESTWYRLKELRAKIAELLTLVEEN
ncbi:hypothetical protein EU527_17140 [Candidatus Thorarchaeota archaeon]|nr:MAG: hypothetical protein EU527_17140 [Candidatus Thorarchaeota archaeon]